MNAILTARLPAALLQRLRARARAEATTPSEIVRRVLDRELGAAGGKGTALEATRRHVGSVASDDVPAGRDARRALEGWRPDRRG